MTELLRIENLSKSFGGLKVSRDISFSLNAGDRTALIGPNGAGKTTLVNQISGALAPSSGRIFLKNRDVTRLGLIERSRLGLVRTFQISRLFPALTVFENVALPILRRTNRLASTFGHVETPAVAVEADAIVNELGLREAASRRVSDLAYGERRLVELAMALALRPEVLLLDEPAAGVGSAEANRILDAISKLPKDIAILLIDHDMDLVFRFATRVMVMAEGALIFNGAPSAAAKDESVRTAYLGSFAHDRGVA
jgi:branched-chain amino acid transport system ATP-binding protein